VANNSNKTAKGEACTTSFVDNFRPLMCAEGDYPSPFGPSHLVSQICLTFHIHLNIKGIY